MGKNTQPIMDMEVLLGKNRSKSSVTNDLFVTTDINVNEQLFFDGNIIDTIDQYNQYLKEKDASDNYRFIFTIYPICSNVLFNAITEITYLEGSSNCIFFGDNPNGTKLPGGKTVAQLNSLLPGGHDYLAYKNGGDSQDMWRQVGRTQLIDDTAFSHPSIGPLVYHCGYDVFSNHLLRKNKFIVTNKLGTENDERIDFNTISDLLRDIDGNNVITMIPKIKVTAVSEHETAKSIEVGKRTSTHAYLHSSLSNYYGAINDKLIEEDGWMGFQNPSGLNVPNFRRGDKDITINKCMNNNKAGEFIDMYPDRSLFSFIPKVNKYRKRSERNWDYCLTYPFRNYYNHELVQSTIELRLGDTIQMMSDSMVAESETKYTLNGLSASIVSEIYDSDGFVIESENIILKTNLRNTFDYGSNMYLTFLGRREDTDGHIHYIAYDAPNAVGVNGVGYNGADKDHYFSINYNDVSGVLFILNGEGYDSEGTHTIDPDSAYEIYDIRVRKVVNSAQCSYYFRIFKAIPNFQNTSIFNGRYLSPEEVEEYCTKDFSSELNKLAFNKTIYNDDTAQIVYDEDVSVSSLADNLGRPLTEVYLTIVKRNKGYEKWYPTNGLKPTYTDSDIEFSHCFGKLTAGIDLPSDIFDYNVHKIHNIDINKEVADSFREALNIPDRPKDLENLLGEITIDGDTTLDGKREFFGDIVELSLSKFSEEVIEDVYFRFNTAQREYAVFDAQINSSGYCESVSGEYANLYKKELVLDDYDNILVNDVNVPFSVVTEKYNVMNHYGSDGNIIKSISYPANLFPEGYYYKPHYKVAIRSLDDFVQQGSHEKMVFTLAEQDGNMVTLNMYRNYYLEKGKPVYIYSKDEYHNTYIGKVENVSGINYEIVTIAIPDEIKDRFVQDGNVMYNIYKPNILKPDYAYELNDGTGRFIYRGVKTNFDLTPDDPLFSSMFTNNAHYFHTNVDFILRRQDSDGTEGLAFGEESCGHVQSFVIEGVPYEHNIEEIAITNGTEENC